MRKLTCTQPLVNLQQQGSIDAATIFQALLSADLATDACPSITALLAPDGAPGIPNPGTGTPTTISDSVLFLILAAAVPLIANLTDVVLQTASNISALSGQSKILFLCPLQAHFLLGSPLSLSNLSEEATIVVNGRAAPFSNALNAQALAQSEYVISLYCHHNHWVVVVLYIPLGIIIPLDSNQHDPSAHVNNARTQRIIAQARQELAQLRALRSRGTILSKTELDIAACDGSYQVLPFKSAAQTTNDDAFYCLANIVHFLAYLRLAPFKPPDCSNISEHCLSSTVNGGPSLSNNFRDKAVAALPSFCSATNAFRNPGSRTFQFPFPEFYIPSLFPELSFSSYSSFPSASTGSSPLPAVPPLPRPLHPSPAPTCRPAPPSFGPPPLRLSPLSPLLPLRLLLRLLSLRLHPPCSLVPPSLPLLFRLLLPPRLVLSLLLLGLSLLPLGFPRVSSCTTTTAVCMLSSFPRHMPPSGTALPDSFPISRAAPLKALSVQLRLHALF